MARRTAGTSPAILVAWRSSFTALINRPHPEGPEFKPAHTVSPTPSRSQREAVAAFISRKLSIHNKSARLAESTQLKSHIKNGNKNRAARAGSSISLPNRCLILSDYSAVEKMNGSLGKLRVVLVVRNQTDRCAFLVQVPQQLHHGFAAL